MTIKFSSPSGDGLVLKNEKNKCKNLKIFVPAWGWVGSIFSPCKNQLVYVFSSPSGDGLVLAKADEINAQQPFSSPLGDGLVLQILTEILKNQVIRYRHNKQL